MSVRGADVFSFIPSTLKYQLNFWSAECTDKRCNK